LLVKCVSETSKMSIFWLKIKVLTSCECLANSLAFQVAILSSLCHFGDENCQSV